MGRSVPPWRSRVELELERLTAYRRALPVADQEALDVLCNEVRQRRAAGGMLPSHDTWQPLLLNMLVGLMAHVIQLRAQIEALEEGHRHD